jgi:wobble nucleotide-excising tRNase
LKISKIKEIKNFSIFKDFYWDQNLTIGNGITYDFKDINIFYGRNYSGKTSLSKIIRALETKQISQKYENPNFKILLSDESEITHTTLQNFEHPIHVYNSDFVKENLKFIHDENANIESFSVTLGGDNQQILDRIQELKDELGSNEENAESQLHLAVKNKSLEATSAEQTHKQLKETLDNLLKDKASGKSESIRSQPNLFGDQDYNIGKLNRIDIPLVLNPTYQPLSDEKELELRNILIQRKLSKSPEIPTYTLNFSTLLNSVDEILKIVVGGSHRIKELVNDPSLNSWVQTGHSLHEDRTHCAFCTNEISAKRRQELAQHFDQETQNLQNRISKGIEYLTSLIDSKNFKINIDTTQYYTQYHAELSQLKIDLQSTLDRQKVSLEQLRILLEQKNGKLFTELKAEYPKDYSLEIENIIKKIEAIRTQYMEQNSLLETQQKEARHALRLNHIYHFLQDINYTQSQINIDQAFQAITPLKTELETLETQRDDILAEIEIEEAKLKSEGEACIRINKILNHDFGHQHLSLEPIETPNTNGQSIKFEIQRLKNGIKTKAHNLSEGECSLISFCYFLAKIQDDLNQDKKPIIWIDDPICSLDSNHIFFIYSLINEKICLQGKYSQLFISTHNLDFLKYLKRLNIEVKRGEKNVKLEISKYQISRSEVSSHIIKMPKYLSEYATEFNYLFNQIHTCASTDILSDNNYNIFYNFSNNARKFIEIYSFFKFPTYYKYDDSRLKVFWNDEIYRLFIGRINNEYSHCAGVLERGMSLMDVPEMHRVAKVIIQKVKEDEQQYVALLESINIDIANDPLSNNNQQPHK